MMTPRAYPPHNKEQFWFLRKSWVVWYPVSRLRNRVCSFLFMAGFGGTQIIQGMVGNPSYHTGRVNEKCQKSLDSKKYNSGWVDECLWFPSGCSEASHGVSSKCKIVQRAPWIPNECTGELNQIHIKCVASCLAKKSVRFFFYLSVPTSVAVFESKKADSMQWSKQCSFVNISCRDCALEQPTARPRQCDTAGK